VQWDGPPQLALWLLANGSPPQELGVQRSPFEIDAADLSAPGAYRLQARAPILGALILAERRFAVAAPRSVAAPPDQRCEEHVRQLSTSLDQLRTTHERTQSENTALYEENSTLRQENATLLQEADKLTRDHENETARAAAHRERQAQLAQENQALSEQLSNLQWRLNAAMTCTVWGYYAFPHPQTIPPTRRTVVVADMRGEVFRTELGCATIQQQDPTSASRCFCVGAPWGG
jgi:hypothetical protein